MTKSTKHGLVEFTCPCGTPFRVKFAHEPGFRVGRQGFVCPHCDTEHATPGEPLELEEQIEGEWRPVRFHLLRS